MTSKTEMNELECEGENVERCGNGYTHECMQNMEARKFFLYKILFIFIAIPSCWTWILVSTNHSASIDHNSSDFPQHTPTASMMSDWACEHIVCTARAQAHPCENYVFADCLAHARVLICRAVCQNFRQPTFEQMQFWFIGKALEFAWNLCEWTCVPCAV